MIQRIRKNQRKADNKKSIKGKKSRYKPKDKRVKRKKMLPKDMVEHWRFIGESLEILTIKKPLSNDSGS